MLMEQRRGAAIFWCVQGDAAAKVEAEAKSDGGGCGGLLLLVVRGENEAGRRLIKAGRGDAAWRRGQERRRRGRVRLGNGGAAAANS